MNQDSKNKQLFKMVGTAKKYVNEGTLYTKRSFLIQSSKLYSYSMTQLLAIFSQRKNSTDLRTFEDWKLENRSIIKGEKAVFILNDYGNLYSKRTALFDVSQTSGHEIEPKVPFNESEFIEGLQTLSTPTLSTDVSVQDNFHNFIHDFAKRGLQDYSKLSEEEKEIVPLVSEYTLSDAFGINQKKEQLLKEIEETFILKPSLRFIPVLQVSNNMSTSIFRDLTSAQLQIKKKSLLTREDLNENNTTKVHKDSLSNDTKGLSNDAEFANSPEVSENDLKTSNQNNSDEISLFDEYEEETKNRNVETEVSEAHVEKRKNLIDDFSFIDTTENVYAKGIVNKIKDNIDAVRLVKKLEKSNEKATIEDQKILARYSGWGGIANELFDKRKDRFASERRELQMLVTPNEYRSIEDSSLTSYYTDPKLIEELWIKLEQSGFKGGTVLDPAMGTGNFFSAMPTHLKEQSKLYGVELDSLTGKIATQLHPSANIKISGFEDTNYSDKSFDLVVGNVPFNNIKISDSTYKNMMIHDYFFKKSMDLVREGGVLAFITSTGTMDKVDHRLRESLAKDSDLIAGFRLPNTAFKATANTDATSDLLIFQKKNREQLQVNQVEPNWVKGSINSTTPNDYFVSNPNNVLGALFVKNFNGQTLSVKETENYINLFKKHSIKLNYNLNVTEYAMETIEEQADTSSLDFEGFEPFTFMIKNNEIFYNNTVEIQKIPPRNKKTLKRIEGMIKLREEIRRLIQIQKTEDYSKNVFDNQLVTVNDLYDSFVNNYGAFHSRENKIAFRNDDYYPLLCSVEVEYENENGNIHYKKSELFFEATVRPQVTITTASNALEALQLSINNKQSVDFSYMQQLYGKEISEIIDELGTEIFLNPENNKYESASEYLSGDVKTKLSLVLEMIEEGNSQFETNRISLEKVIPHDLGLADIKYQIGTNWIPKEYYTEFMVEKFKMGDFARENIYKIELNPSTKEYFISGKSDFYSPLVTKTYGTKDRNAYQLFEDLLNFKNTTVMTTVEVDDGTGKLIEKKVLDSEATLLCREKQEVLRTEFKHWVEQYPSRRARLEEIYNDRFNRFVVRKYDGSSLTFGTMNKSIELRNHQKNAVMRTITEGRGLYAHVVGSGKTLTMIASGMKLKELGLVKKPLYIVPKSLIRPFGEEILRSYPDKKVLIATDEDFKKENRKMFISKVATGSYDAIVMGHTQFAKTPLSKKRYSEFLKKELTQLENMLIDCEEDSHSFKAIKGELKRAEERITKQLFSMDRDRILDFEDLGVDFLFVDEAHMFKNLGVRTKLGSVAGISTTSANKSLDMLAKIEYIQSENDGRGIVFATGTPISNSMCELYTMMRYLAPDVLEELGISHFDDWQGVFGEIENKLEMTPEASGYRVRSRFSKFHNIPELMIQFSRFADIQTADMLNLPTPTMNKIIVETKATLMQEMKMDELAKRAEWIRNGGVSPSVDNMLKITSEARRMALDPRLLSEDLYTREDSQKLIVCANNVYKLWKENMESKAAQIIFSDIGTPSNKNFNIYNEIKDMLIEKGIPESEIQFIHDAPNDVQKSKLFKDVRTGNVRVLLGSTEKLGTGVNVQNRLIAIHDLDCPWRPSDLEQRGGRVERQGNMFSEVYRYTYITKGTFDSYLFQIQEQKLTYITQIMSSKSISRSADDVDELVVQASEVKALATGNPLIKERADLENEVRRLNLLKSSHYQQQNSIEKDIEQAERLIPAYEDRLVKIEKDIVQFKNNLIDGKEIEVSVNGLTFDEDTKKTEIGQKILDRVQEIRSITSDIKVARQYEVATFNGFQVYFNGYVSNSPEMILLVRGSNEYLLQLKPDSAISPILKLNNLNNEMEKSLKRTISLLDEERQSLTELADQHGKPFDRLNELSEKQIQLKLMDEAIELGISLDELKELKNNNCLDGEIIDVSEENSNCSLDNDFNLE